MPAEQAIDWVQKHIGTDSIIENIERLPGSTSAELYDISISHTGVMKNLVLRLFTLNEWLAEEPDLAKHEAASLHQARGIPIPTPELIAFDQTGQFCGVPAVLMRKLPGEGDLKPKNMVKWLDEQAKAMSLVHQLDAKAFPWRYFSYSNLDTIEVPNWTNQPELWSQALRIVKGHKPIVQETFIHRDFHPANLLWREGRISGIVDWVNACRGPAGVDVGHCRMNLLMLFGVETANQFLHAYQEHEGANFQYHLFYDLLALCDFVLPGPPTVYRGWKDFGITHLTDDMMKHRADEYLISLMQD